MDTFKLNPGTEQASTSFFHYYLSFYGKDAASGNATCPVQNGPAYLAGDTTVGVMSMG